MTTNIWAKLRGVATLSVCLTFIYVLERALAAVLGFPDAEAMLSILTVEQKQLLAATVGPFLHQGISHISENLVFLLLFGGYVEWEVGRRRLYTYSVVIGYLSTWLLLFAGGAAVGASSITNGLQAITGFIGLVRLVEGLRPTETFRDLLHTALYVIPFVFGLGFAYNSIMSGVSNSTGGTQAIHALAAVVGGFLGVLYVLEQLLIKAD
jgi:membrane associated rhomboid family serine protease